MRTRSPYRAPARARARSTPRRLQPAVGLVEGLGVGEIGQRHRPRRPAGRTTMNEPSSSRSMREALGRGPVDDDRPPAPAAPPGPRCTASAIRPTSCGTPVAGDGRDAVAVERKIGTSQVGTWSRPRGGAARAGRAGSARARPGARRSCSAGRALGQRRQVEQQQEDPGPLDVAQELVAEAPALAGALDETGDVGHDELDVVVGPHDAEVGLERGERVVGDLRLGRGDPRDQRGLAHVGEARRGPRRP